MYQAGNILQITAIAIPSDLKLVATALYIGAFSSKVAHFSIAIRRQEKPCCSAQKCRTGAPHQQIRKQSHTFIRIDYRYRSRSEETKISSHV
jgi:hypothetical protein